MILGFIKHFAIFPLRCLYHIQIDLKRRDIDTDNK